MKLLEKIKQFIFLSTPVNPNPYENGDTVTENTTVIDLSDALAHYCPICKRGFERKIGKKTHDRLKHK